MRHLTVVLFFGIILNAQTIRINEVVSSNSEYYDEDGDTPDWIELYNYGTQSVNLNGWFISDDLTDLTKWTFPSVTIPSNEYLLLWASGKNRFEISTPRTLITHGDTHNYIIPNTEPDPNWNTLGFDDSSWQSGASGFGYSDGDDTTIVPNGTLSVYLRKNFTISNLASVISLILDVDYDDAFVAYINGVEVARANINGVPPAYNAPTLQDHEAQMYGGGNPDRFLISDFSSVLVEGNNVLAIQAHNISSNSSDLTMIPFLSAIFSESNPQGIQPPEILNLNEENRFHTNFKISTNSETLTLSNAAGAIIDQVLVEGLPPDTSIGVSNNSGALVSYLDTTPGYQNSNEEFLGAIQNRVIFSELGGLLTQPISLTMSGNQLGQLIRYTLDGSAPTEQSPIYSSPLQISENTSVRAQIFSSNYLPSKVTSQSYIFGANHNIDYMLLSVDPDDFFDEDTGIYVFGPEGTYDNWAPYFGANFWEDWEREVHFSFYEHDSNISVNYNGGVKIFGAWSRGLNGQRSLALFARGKYGDSSFDHSFFDELTYNKFESMVLRNSGNDWLATNMKDITLTSLMRGTELDFQEHNPVATYINGEYWGFYNLREKVNKHMLASKHNLNADEISILAHNAEVVDGTNEEYNQLIDYVNTTDLSVDSNFEYVRQQVDLKEYALYQASNIFFNNTDWPGNNIKFWKHPTTKWRWIMYDTDFGFGPSWSVDNYWEDTLSFALNPNGPGWPNPPWSTLLFRKLVTNIGFRNQFINRYADELNTRFLPDNVHDHIDTIFASIEPEIVAHFTRWKDDPSVTFNITDINNHVAFYVNNMKIFGTNRPPIVKEHIKQQFDLPNFHPLSITISDTNEGFVEVNDNLHIQENSWTGDYFETVPVSLTAIPEFGYQFSHWSGDLYSTQATIEVDLDGAFEVIPNFSPAQATLPIVINEINYKSVLTFNADDWIELYNPNEAAVDLSNWEIKDNDDTHSFIIPAGTEITGHGYLVIVKDISDFLTVFPGADHIGELGFGLGTMDAVRLYSETGALQDEVSYDSVAPWPTCANETGYSLELIDPSLDNSLAQNWDCINPHGSPNMVNNTQLSYNDDLEKDTIIVYPNPVKETLYFGTSSSEYFDVEIHSIIGQIVASKKSTNKMEVNHLDNGVYFLKIKSSDGQIFVKRVIKY